MDVEEKSPEEKRLELIFMNLDRVEREAAALLQAVEQQDQGGHSVTVRQLDAGLRNILEALRNIRSYEQRRRREDGRA